jgi:cytochrome c
MRMTFRVGSVLLAALLAGACSSNPAPAPSAAANAAGAPAGGPSPAEASAEATKIFSMRCTPCHGPEGRGDGPASGALTPHPRNFHDTVWQKQASDEHIEKIIQFGGAAVGKSPAMPPNPDLTDKPAIVAALKDHIRTLGQ